VDLVHQVPALAGVQPLGDHCLIADGEPDQHVFEVTLDVTEPMGMETLVHFLVEGTEVCGRVEPTAAKGSGEAMVLRANLDHMHFIDPATNAVL